MILYLACLAGDLAGFTADAFLQFWVLEGEFSIEDDGVYINKVQKFRGHQLSASDATRGIDLRALYFSFSLPNRMVKLHRGSCSYVSRYALWPWDPEDPQFANFRITHCSRCKPWS